MLAGAIAGLLSTGPAIGLLHAFGSLEVEARILGTTLAGAIGAGWVAMAIAGAVYSRLFGRTANDVRGGWLFGMAFGFVVWAAGAVLILPLVSGGVAPAGHAALGVFLSLVRVEGRSWAPHALRAQAIAQDESSLKLGGRPAYCREGSSAVEVLALPSGDHLNPNPFR